jgi:hypothetical protein
MWVLWNLEKNIQVARPGTVLQVKRVISNGKYWKTWLMRNVWWGISYRFSVELH